METVKKPPLSEDDGEQLSGAPSRLPLQRVPVQDQERAAAVAVEGFFPGDEVVVVAERTLEDLDVAPQELAPAPREDLGAEGIAFGNGAVLDLDLVA